MLITLNKKVPVGAGMGGGSSDAAAVLRALNRHYAAFSPQELETLSAEVGSDVPFCVRGGTALATGRGEKLESLPDMPACDFIICKPDFSVSTPELFKKLDQCAARCHPDTAGIVNALHDGDLEQICRRMYNVFEDVDDRRMRTVREIKGRLLDHGALGAVMTGTGSAVFGVFRPGAAPDAAVNELRREYGFCEKARCVGRTN
jgi:4-diphosphocytidyl-2-C-methyl-D-erythritol kinase